MKKKIIIGVWLVFLGLFGGIPLYILSVSHNFLGLFGGMPSLAQLENPENDLSSTLYYANG
jgi:penicillin-binding protein 1A